MVSRSNPQPRTHRTTKVEHAASPAQASTRTNDPTRTPAVAATIDASPSRPQDVCGPPSSNPSPRQSDRTQGSQKSAQPPEYKAARHLSTLPLTGQGAPPPFGRDRHRHAAHPTVRFDAPRPPHARSPAHRERYNDSATPTTPQSSADAPQLNYPHRPKQEQDAMPFPSRPARTQPHATP